MRLVLTQRKDDNSSTQNSSSEITTFEQCVSAGNPIMESSPEQCNAMVRRLLNKLLQKTS